MPISSTATAGTGYKFIGWYDSEGNKVSDDMLNGTTISYTTTGDATYYARFEKVYTQTYIRQVGSGDIWKETDKDEIGTLEPYGYIDVLNTDVSSKATAGTGYKFIGWYYGKDNDVTKVEDTMLTNGDTTIKYKITSDATYYARFQATITQTFIRQVWDGKDWVETTDNTIATLTLDSHTDVVGIPISSTAIAKGTYQFVGWFDGNDDNATKVSDDMLLPNDKTTISYTTTEDATYYARFKAIVTQTFIPQIWNGKEWETITNDNIGTVSPDHHTDVVGETANSTATAKDGYKFVGWYDGNDDNATKVSYDMLLPNDKTTISYETTDNATYYARFEKVYTLNVNKIDGDKNPLANADFTLYQEDSNGEKNIVDTATTNLNEDNTKATAVFELTFSPDVVYYLDETEPPQGYQGINTPLKITFDDSGNVLINETIKEITGNVINIEIVNYLMLHMPETGTIFTSDMCVVTGFSLMALATIGLGCKKIRRYNQK